MQRDAGWLEKLLKIWPFRLCYRQSFLKSSALTCLSPSPWLTFNLRPLLKKIKCLPFLSSACRQIIPFWKWMFSCHCPLEQKWSLNIINFLSFSFYSPLLSLSVFSIIVWCCLYSHKFLGFSSLGQTPSAPGVWLICRHCNILIICSGMFLISLSISSSSHRKFTAISSICHPLTCEC